MSHHIYIVISQTGSALSRILKLLTKAEYNHASISLSPELDTMYSFGRLEPYNPFVGGFVRESPNYGTFKRFSNTKVIVLSVLISDKQYQGIRRRINDMYSNKEEYHYNYLGLVLAGIHIHYRHENRFYCSEFVKEMLVSQDVSDAERLRPIVKPVDFLQLPSAARIYCGRLTNYTAPNKGEYIDQCSAQNAKE